MLERSFAAERRRPSRLRRRLGRLMQMSAAEIAYRAAEQARIAADRRRVQARARDRRFDAVPRDGRFFFTASAEHRRAMIRRLEDDPARLAALRIEADAALEHHVALLGFGLVELGPAID